MKSPQKKISDEGSHEWVSNPDYNKNVKEKDYETTKKSKRLVGAMWCQKKLNSFKKSKILENNSLIQYSKLLRDSTNQCLKLPSKSKNLQLSIHQFIQAPRESFSFKKTSNNLFPIIRRPSLPLIGKTGPIPRISNQTFIRLIMGESFPEITGFTIVDCRFSYEFFGGHVKGAINCSRKKELEMLYSKLKTETTENIAVLFYCEFSQNRGPLMASKFRAMDRKHNIYPNLSFPDVYIVNGGYREIWSISNKMLVNSEEPQSVFVLLNPFNYISMHDKTYKNECRKMTQNFKKEWKVKVFKF